MASKSIKVRAKAIDGVAKAKCLFSHPMETGLRKDKKTGKVIPAHFIQEVVAVHNDNIVLTAYWSGGIAQNPYMAFKINSANKGDSLKVSWSDNKGDSDSIDIKIK
jgi:sulfur-oxidizing protein SoxZ